MVERTSIGTRGIGDKSPPIGVAYVSVPIDVDREKFVQSCLKTYTVCLRTELGDFYKSVAVDKQTMQDIEFPLDSSKRGSPVVYVKMPKHKQPIVIAILDWKNLFSKVENEQAFRLFRSSNSGFVDVHGQGKRKKLDLFVTSEEDDTGELNVKVTNKNKTAKFISFVKGFFNLNATEGVDIKSSKKVNINIVNNEQKEIANIRYEAGVGLTVSDEFGNVLTMKDGGYTMNSKQQDLKEILNDFVSEVSNAIVQTPSGAGTISPSTVSKLRLIRDRLNQFFK